MHPFCTNIKQRETPDPNMMSKERGYIRFDVWKIIDGHHYTNQLDVTFDHFDVKQLSQGTMLTSDLRRTILSMIGVTEARQQGVVDEILKVLQVSLPVLPIDVRILEQIYNIYVPRVSPAARLEPDVKPATESSIESLEKVRLDSLEEPESPCTICSVKELNSILNEIYFIMNT